MLIINKKQKFDKIVDIFSVLAHEKSGLLYHTNLGILNKAGTKLKLPDNHLFMFVFVVDIFLHIAPLVFF